MALIVALTGAAGFFASFALLHLGVKFLWLRYPLAVATAYLTFLLLLWCWLRLKRDDLLESLDVPGSGPGSHFPGGGATPENVWRAGGGRSGGGGASASFGEGLGTVDSSPGASSPLSGESSTTPEGPDLPDAENLAGIAALVALAAAAWVAVWMTLAAPAFLAELLLDTALAAGLYRRLRAVEEGRWLRTAMRQTAWPFVCVALAFALAGALMQTYMPSAHSIGEVIRRVIENR